MKETEKYLGINVDYSRDKIIPEQGLALLQGKGFYKKSHETSPQQSFARASSCYSFGDHDFAQRIYEYASKGWFTFASPVLSNAMDVKWPKFTKEEFPKAGQWLKRNVTPDGMPISCFLLSLGDSKSSLVETRKEASCLSMEGGGIGIYAGNRAPDEKSTGVMAHMRGYDADTLSYKQRESRRGSMAAYMDIDHPEIMQFISMRNPVGGDSNKKCFNLNNAVNIPDWFIKAVILDETYELKDPKHGGTGRFLKASEVWETILETRFETGEPYILFTDTVNRNIPEWITNPLYKVTQSNLCVAPETNVLTAQGQIRISELEGKKVDIWNGYEWSNVEVVKTGETQKLIKVTVSGGMVLECTPYHKFYVVKEGETVEVRAKDLQTGDELIQPETLPEFVLNDVYVDGFVPTVVSVVDEGRTDDTFCFTEHKRHLGMFNGMLTGQCSEITLMTDDLRSAVCCLSSLNVEKYEEWKNTTIVEDLVRLLDNVLEYFILLAPKELHKAVFSAKKERAIGLGTLGFHSFLQSKNIPFESGGFNSAAQFSEIIYSNIKSKAMDASMQLAEERGEPDDLIGSGMRNSHLLAIAPNASSSSMVGASPSIEPWNANAFNAQGRAGSFLIKNKYLEKILADLGKDTKEVWSSIITAEGSVQHLDFLDDDTKKVFKTATEIDPSWVIELAGIRQKHICQSQSLNIFVPNNISMQEMSDIHIKGWSVGIKTFYYCRSKPATRANLGTGGDKPLNAVPVVNKIDFEECLSCQG